MALSGVDGVAGDSFAFPWPFTWASCLVAFCGEVLSDRVVLAIMFFAMGMATVLILEAFFVLVQLRESVRPPPSTPRSDIKMPEALKTRIDSDSLKQNEDCVWLNFLTHFLFAELRDSIALRRFLTKKIQNEFEEVLTSRTGVFMDELFLRDYDLGEKFPVFMETSIDKCDVNDDTIETLDIRTHILYDGGFQICIDAALPFGRTANISVRLLKLKGFLRLRFTSVPFSHWCFSFYEEPEIELDVSAQLDGRPVMKLKNVISHQIRKIIRKKHMLPMYKIRYKPFFRPKEESVLSMPENLQISGVPVASGVLEVTLTGASNLPIINKGAQLYCTLSTDPLPWNQMMAQSRLKRPIVTKELVKHVTDPSIGLTLKDDLVSDRLHPVVIVEQVLVGSPAHLADVKLGDIIVSVNGHKVTSAKQATKVLKSGKDKISIQVEGSTEDDNAKSSKSDTTNLAFESTSREGHKPLGVDGVDGIDEDDEGNTVSAPINTQVGSARKTKKSSCQNPTWDQKFIFAVDPSMAYLNICVWSHGGDRTSRNDIIGASSHDVLVGHVNLNLDDIYLHCLLTLSGKLYDRVKLKHGHHQTEAELAKAWSSHKGWNPELMYGDLTLAFHYVPSLLTDKQRHELASANGQMESFSNRASEIKLGSEVKGSPARSFQSPESATISDSSNYTEGHHQFYNTSFVNATFCDYCGKKIWMKEAFKCRTCSMVCHKKCLVKCLVNTFCTEEGARKRSDLDEMWEPLAASNRGRSGTGYSDNIDVQDENASDRDTHKDAASIDGRNNNQSENGLTPEESRSPSRFRNLRDRTERIKDNVVRSIKKTKTPLTLNENMIMEAKEVGVQLFCDLEPAQRRDKLDELITQLDEQLKLEMKTKEELETELEACHSTDPSNPMARRKSDVRALETKINKSTDKLNAMRLLMLQYCTALQVCMKDPDTDVVGDLEKMEISPLPQSSPQNSRVSYMGGIVKRASSSVKEKMSSIRKDFGKKGSPKISPKHAALESFKTKQEEGGKKNSKILSSILGGFSTNTDKNQRHSEENEIGDTSALLFHPGDEISSSIKIPEPNHTRSRSLVDEALLRGDSMLQPGSLPSKLSLPKIEVNDSDESQVEGADNDDKESEAKSKKLSRSSSDSHLEINKMVSLNPDDILRYQGNSLPKVFVSEDDNSESDDYFILDSSDDDYSEEEENNVKSSYGRSMLEEGSSQIVLTPGDIIRGSIKYNTAADRKGGNSNSGKEENSLNGSLSKGKDQDDDDSDIDQLDENDHSENRHSYIV